MYIALECVHTVDGMEDGLEMSQNHIQNSADVRIVVVCEQVDCKWDIV